MPNDGNQNENIGININLGLTTDAAMSQLNNVLKRLGEVKAEAQAIKIPSGPGYRGGGGRSSGGSAAIPEPEPNVTRHVQDIAGLRLSLEQIGIELAEDQKRLISNAKHRVAQLKGFAARINSAVSGIDSAELEREVATALKSIDERIVKKLMQNVKELGQKAVTQVSSKTLGAAPSAIPAAVVSADFSKVTGELERGARAIASSADKLESAVDKLSVGIGGIVAKTDGLMAAPAQSGHAPVALPKAGNMPYAITSRQKEVATADDIRSAQQLLAKQKIDQQRELAKEKAAQLREQGERLASKRSLSDIAGLNNVSAAKLYAMRIGQGKTTLPELIKKNPELFNPSSDEFLGAGGLAYFLRGTNRGKTPQAGILSILGPQLSKLKTGTSEQRRLAQETTEAILDLMDLEQMATFAANKASRKKGVAGTPEAEDIGIKLSRLRQSTGDQKIRQFVGLAFPDPRMAGGKLFYDDKGLERGWRDLESSAEEIAIMNSMQRQLHSEQVTAGAYRVRKSGMRGEDLALRYKPSATAVISVMNKAGRGVYAPQLSAPAVLEVVDPKNATRTKKVTVTKPNETTSFMGAYDGLGRYHSEEVEVSPADLYRLQRQINRIRRAKRNMGPQVDRTSLVKRALENIDKEISGDFISDAPAISPELARAGIDLGAVAREGRSYGNLNKAIDAIKKAHPGAWTKKSNLSPEENKAKLDVLALENRIKGLIELRKRIATENYDIRADLDAQEQALLENQENIRRVLSRKYPEGSAMSELIKEHRGVGQILRPGLRGQMHQQADRRFFKREEYSARFHELEQGRQDAMLPLMEQIRKEIQSGNPSPSALEAVQDPVFKDIYRSMYGHSDPLGGGRPNILTRKVSDNLRKILGINRPGREHVSINDAYNSLVRDFMRTGEKSKIRSEDLQKMLASGAGEETLEQLGVLDANEKTKLASMMKRIREFKFATGFGTGQDASPRFWMQTPWSETPELKRLETGKEYRVNRMLRAITNIAESPEKLYKMISEEFTPVKFSRLQSGKVVRTDLLKSRTEAEAVADPVLETFEKMRTDKPQLKMLMEAVAAKFETLAMDEKRGRSSGKKRRHRSTAENAARDEAVASAARAAELLGYDVMSPNVLGYEKSQKESAATNARAAYKDPTIAAAGRDAMRKGYFLYSHLKKIETLLWGNLEKMGETEESIRKAGIYIDTKGKKWSIGAKGGSSAGELASDPLFASREGAITSQRMGNMYTQAKAIERAELTRKFRAIADADPEIAALREKRLQEKQGAAYLRGSASGPIRDRYLYRDFENYDAMASSIKKGRRESLLDKITTNIASKYDTPVAMGDLGIAEKYFKGLPVSFASFDEGRRQSVSERMMFAGIKDQWGRDVASANVAASVSAASAKLTKLTSDSGAGDGGGRAGGGKGGSGGGSGGGRGWDGGFVPPEPPPIGGKGFGGEGIIITLLRQIAHNTGATASILSGRSLFTSNPEKKFNEMGWSMMTDEQKKLSRARASQSAVAYSIATGRELTALGAENATDKLKARMGLGVRKVEEGAAASILALESRDRKMGLTQVAALSERDKRFTELGMSLMSRTQFDQTKAREKQYIADDQARKLDKQHLSATKEEFDFNSRLQSEGALTTTMRRVLMFGGTSMAVYQAAGAMRTFFDTIVKMDKQLIDLRKTLGGTEQDFNKLADSAINIARSTGAGTQGVLDSVELFSKQYKRPQDLEILSTSAALFSNLSGQNIQTSVETLTSAIEQYNLSVSQAAQLTDSWAAMAASANVTTKDLGDAFGSAAGPAKEAGLTMHELNAMVTTIAATTGKSGREIGTGLKRMFERASSPENEKKLAAEGIRTRVLGENDALEARNFVDILDDLVNGVNKTGKRWDDMSASQKRHIAVLMAGARQYDAFIALMNNYTKVQDLVTISQNSSGAATEQNDRLMGSLAKKFELLRTEIDSMARSVGTVLVPVFSGLVGVLTDVIGLISKFPKASMAVGAIGAFFGLKGMGDLLLKGVLTKNMGNVDVFKNKAVGSFAAPFMDQPPVRGTYGAVGFHESARFSTRKMFAGLGLDVINKLGMSDMFGKRVSAAADARRESVAGGAMSFGKAIVGGLSGLVGTVARLSLWMVALTVAFEGLERIIRWIAPTFKELFVDRSREMIESLDQEGKKGRQEVATNRAFSLRASSLAVEVGALQEVGMSKQREREVSAQITGLVDDAAKTDPSLQRFFSRDMTGSIVIDGSIVTRLNEFSSELDRINKEKIFERLSKSLAGLIGSIDEIASKSGGRQSGWSLLAGAFTGDLWQRTIAGLSRAAKSDKVDITGSGIDEAVTVGDLVKRAKEERTNLRRQVSSGGLADFVQRTGGVITLAGQRGGMEWGELQDLQSRMEQGYRLGDIKKQDILEDRPRLLADIEKLVDTDFPNLKGAARTKKINDLFDFNENQAIERARAAWVNANIRPTDSKEQRANIRREAEEYFVRPEKTLERAVSNGVLALDKTRGLRAKMSDLEPQRIDYALNKSLTSNFRNASSLGFYQSNFLQNTLGAFDQAIMDLNNNIEMAASEQEEAVMKYRDQALIDARERRSSALKDFSTEVAGGVSPEKSRLRAEAANEDVRALRIHKQAIQEENDERRRLKEELIALRDVIKTISLLDQVIRPALKSNISSTLQRGQAMSDISLQSVTDIDYLDKQIAREKEMQARGGYANTARGRNALKALYDQRKDLVKNRDKGLQQNDFFTNLVRDTGQGMFGSMTGLLTDQAFESMYAGMFGEAGKGMSGLNPVANLLGDKNQYERKSLEYLRQIAAATSSMARPSSGGLVSGLGAAGLIGSLNPTTGMTGGGMLAGLGVGALTGGIAITDSLMTSDEMLDSVAGGINSIKSMEVGSGLSSNLGSGLGLSLLPEKEGTTSGGTKFGKFFNGKVGMGIMGALSGGMMGNQITAAQGKTGLGGIIGGALGGAAGTVLGGPIGGAIGSLAGGLLGALFDTPKEPELKELPEIEEEQLKELQQINKNLNTVNETMENIINAPSNFTLPIPKGILNNSITAQSALATPLQAGGLIIKSGPAYLHAGERVSRDGESGGGMSVMNNITINGSNKDPKEIANEVAAAVRNELYQQTQRTGGYRTRW